MIIFGKKSASLINIILYLWLIFAYSFAISRDMSFYPFDHSFYYRVAWAVGIAYSTLVLFLMFIRVEIAKKLIAIDLMLSLAYTSATLIHPLSELPFWIAHLSILSLFIEKIPEKNILIYHFPKQVWVFGIIFLYIIDVVFILPKLGKDRSR